MSERPASPFLFNGEIGGLDPEISSIINVEEERQARKLIMIASESICPKPVRDALSCVFNNIYAEGYPNPRMTKEERDKLLDWPRSMSFHRRYSDWRYYKGTDYCNWVEVLAQLRCAELFKTAEVPAEKIYVNVQPLSGAAANNAVYNAFVKPGEVVMGMNLSHGGHLTHGSPVNRSGRNYTIIPYFVHAGTGKIDFKEMERLAIEWRPKMIIAGFSAYPWAVDWAAFREICDKVPGKPARLVADISHTAGLVVAGVNPSPIGYADAITFTTHKTLCGPRGAVVMTTDEDTAKELNFGVFPGEQGGPHIHQIAAKAVAFKIAATPEFRELQTQIVKNAQALAEAFKKRGIKIAYGGTDTHICLVDLKSVKTPTGRPLTGEIASRILDQVGIVANKNTILGDTSAAHPTAVRFGTTWLTQRGMKEADMDAVADVVVRALSNVWTFSYLFGTGPAGRGKIDAGLLADLRKDVEKLESGLAREFEPPSDKTGYPHFCSTSAPVARQPEFVKDDAGSKASGKHLLDISNLPVYEITGERASAMFADLTTSSVFARPDKAAVGTFFFDKEAKIIDDAALVKDSPSSYFIVAHPERGGRLLEWLRGNSDGYLLFDEKDYFAKVQGPVSVLDRTGDMIAVAISGEGAAAVLAKCDINVEPAPGGCARVKARGGEIIVARLENWPGKGESMLLLGEKSAMKKMWKLLVENKGLFKEAGPATEANMRKEAGIPTGAETATIFDMYEKLPERFDPIKTYFVGSTALRAKIKLQTRKKKYVYKPEELPLRKSCLYEEHLKLTKKSNIIPFAGWEMPVIYTSISEEHEAVRKRAGLFDVSHMGVLEISGPYATRFLNLVTSNYLDWIRPGTSMYGYLFYPDGSCVDDILMYKQADDKYMVVVNASNAEKDLHWLLAVNSGEVIIDDEYPAASLEGKVTIKYLKDPTMGAEQRVDVALQGPASIKILLKAATSPEQARMIRRLARNEFVETELFGIRLIVARTGYTGEKFGYEFYLHPSDAPKLWNSILEIGKEFGVAPTGLGARDSTRTESGFPLYGHELAGDLNITPIEAGYGGFVKLHKTFFIGRKAMMKNYDDHAMETCRFQMDGDKIRMVRPGDPVAAIRGEMIGKVTSCTMVGDRQIGMAYILKKYNVEGTPLAVYPLPRTGKPPEEGPKNLMKPGDKILLYETGRIISRFPGKSKLVEPPKKPQ
jgi:glycine cleavage system T protein